MHSLIIGMTESGKTSLAKMIATDLKKRKKRVVVLDPLQDEWDCDMQFTDSVAFLKYCQENTDLFCFIDEGGQSIGRYNKEMEWLATRSRHWGHSCFFISQGCTQLPRIIRAQCSRMYVFAVGKSDTDLLAEECRKDDLRKIEQFDKGEFFVVERFGPLKRGRIDFAKWKCTIAVSESNPAPVGKGNRNETPPKPAANIDPVIAD